jgi:hypothetical protein
MHDAEKLLISFEGENFNKYPAPCSSFWEKNLMIRVLDYLEEQKYFRNDNRSNYTRSVVLYITIQNSTS